jgi:hypothetical protein
MSSQSEHEETKVIIEETTVISHEEVDVIKDATVFAQQPPSGTDRTYPAPLIPIIHPNHHNLKSYTQQAEKSPSLKSPEDGFFSKRLRWSKLVPKTKQDRQDHSSFADPSSDFANSPSSIVNKRLSLMESLKSGGESDDDGAAVNRFVIARDLFIGFSEGFSMPFILVCGLSVFEDSFIVLAVGLSFVFASSLVIFANALVTRQYVIETYNDKRKMIQEEVDGYPDGDLTVIEDLFADFNVDFLECAPISRSLHREKENLVEFLLRFEVGKGPSSSLACTIISASAISVSSIISGILTVIPFALSDVVMTALLISSSVASLGLFCSSYVKGRVLGGNPLGSALLITISSVGAGAIAYGIAKGIQQIELHKGTPGGGEAFGVENGGVGWNTGNVPPNGWNVGW